MKVKTTLFISILLAASPTLYAADATAVYPKSQMNGLLAFQNACVACHGAGLVGAPRMGDKTAGKS